jgi:ribosome biogenesis GTPase
MTIRELGFDDWFAERAPAPNHEHCGVARVSAVDRGAYRIIIASGEVPAELAGRLAYQIDSPAGLPCVGDWVIAHSYNQGAAAIIHQVFPRKTLLRRKTAGDAMERQMIAANIDAAFIVQSCHYDFNPNRLDRYLVMAADGGVEPIVLLTKTDLITQDALEQKLEIIRSAAKARAIALSAVTGAGFATLEQMLSAGKTYCLLGSSGVGKTTLVNRLLGRDAFETRSVSGTGEGAHTTTRRQLVVLAQGALFIDTPGMRELGVMGASEGISMGFEDFSALSAACRYANCSHEREPGCAVRTAVENGELDEDRYANYLKLKKESAYHEMSYPEKRKKDKTFGRFIKSVKKHVKY